MKIEEQLKKIYRFLASTELAVALFLLISVVAIPGTFLENRTLYSSPPFLFLLALFGLNLILCTVRRYRAISWPVLVLHAGVLTVLAGFIVASYGFVATVNMYEGTMVDHVYRWDRKMDLPLGVNLALKKINREYYPMPVRIGVLKGEKKEKLFELKTGQSFEIGGYSVAVGALDNETENLRLSLSEKGRILGTFNTLSGENDLPADFPYKFVLVAFVTPKLKRLWVDLMLTDASGILAEGTSEVNGPFQWNGLYFFNTQIDTDPNGVQFAGIQIVRDPGRWLVFLGMTIVGIGACLATFRRWHGSR